MNFSDLISSSLHFRCQLHRCPHSQVYIDGLGCHMHPHHQSLWRLCSTDTSKRIRFSACLFSSVRLKSPSNFKTLPNCYVLTLVFQCTRILLLSLKWMMKITWEFLFKPLVTSVCLLR